MKKEINNNLIQNSYYLHLNEWLKNKFGERVLKICVDGGFTCPNRDGKCSTGGCIFCGERGSGEHLKNLSIENQVSNYLSSYRSLRANKYILYFQNFTNTYDTIQNLKLKYDSGLISDKIVGIAIATRPDCIDEEIASLIKSYQKNYFVWVELGFQTSNEKTGKLINRGYNNENFTNAVKILNQYEIPVVTHLMIGLPNETFDDLKNTITFLNSHKIWGLKIHSTYVIKDTVLNKMYENKQYLPLNLEDYIMQACYVLSHINPEIVIHRISGDAPKDLLVAPEWNLHKKIILNGINKYLKDNNIYQGCFFNN